MYSTQFSVAAAAYEEYGQAADDMDRRPSDREEALEQEPHDWDPGEGNANFKASASAQIGAQRSRAAPPAGCGPQGERPSAPGDRGDRASVEIHWPYISSYSGAERCRRNKRRQCMPWNSATQWPCR